MHRHTRVRITATALAIIAVTASAVVVAPSAYADEATGEATGCKLTAGTPFKSNQTPSQMRIEGSGSRSGCVQTREWIRVRLRQEVALWPDKTLAEVTVYGKVNTGIKVLDWCWIDFQVPSIGTSVHTDIYTNAGGSAKSSSVFFRDAKCS
jgi:hypothetical protein